VATDAECVFHFGNAVDNSEASICI